MTQSIRIGIVGYGNLGRGVETAIQKNPDMNLVGVFTRRAPEQLDTVDAATPVFSVADLNDFQDKIDVLILCGGSKDDLPKQTPE